MTSSRFGGLRRLVAALSGALLLQLSLLGSGVLCPMEHADAAQAQGEHSAMQMPAGEGAPVHQHAPVGCQVGGDEGCGLPSAPGQCAAMTTCVATAAPAAAPSVQLAAARIVAELPEPAAIHSGFSPAPELPPPRA